MKIKTHPKHFDISQISQAGQSSGYYKALDRFNQILSDKLEVRGSEPKYKNSTKVDKGQFSVDSKIRLDKKFPIDVDEIIKNIGLDTFDSKDIIDSYFSDSPMKGLGVDFQKAQKDHGVNAIFLSALAALESGRGTSKIARDKNNLFGFKAYDENPYSFAKKFPDVETGIDEVARYIKKEYLTEGGKHYNGTSIEDVNKKYATDPEWHQKIEKIMREIVQGI